MKKVRGVLLDIDGTLIDSNDAHAQAWVRAMHEHGYEVPFDKVRPLIGMGGDKVLPTVLNIEKDSPEGKQISQRRKSLFLQQYLSTVKPFPRALDLLQKMRDQGLKLVIATSAEPDELQAMLRLISDNAAELFENATTAKDASQSKPDPDVIEAAISRVDLPPSAVIMVGDTPYDIEAAKKADVSSIAFRSGGWSDQDLKGALAIYDGPGDLLDHFEESPLVR